MVRWRGSRLYCIPPTLLWSGQRFAVGEWTQGPSERLHSVDDADAEKVESLFQGLAGLVG